jgi:GH43 family beta-xylosidase
MVMVLSLALLPGALAATTYNNPRDTSMERPDPFVYKHTDGYYYGTHTTMSGGAYIPRISLYRSKSLIDLFKGENKVIWNAPSSGWNSRDIWAPEIHLINGTFYIYYSGGTRVGVLRCSSSDPWTGTWSDQGRISPDVWAIDGTVLQQNGNLYLIWSGQNNGQVLVINRMSSPTTLTGSPVQICAPTLSWEQHGLKVNEGPFALYRNNKVFLVYSASYCSTQYYCLGMLTISNTADPMVASNWTKSQSPVFQKANSLYGVGHACFTKSPDGSEDWMVYHACITASDSYQPRYVCMQKFTWNSDGTPNFGAPGGRTSALPVPAGEGGTVTSTPTPTRQATPTPTRTPSPTVRATPTPTTGPTSTPGSGTPYQAENASYGGGATTESTNSGYNGSGYINFPSSGGYLQFNNVNGGSGGTATLRIRNALGVTSSRTGRIQVNGGTWQYITFNTTGAWTTWVITTVSVTLNSGTGNTIRLESTGQDLANIDELDLTISGSTPTPTQRVANTPTPTRGVTPTPTSRQSSTPTPTRTSTPTPTQGGTGYAVIYDISSDWGTGGTVNVTIKNNTATAVNGWTLAWTFPGNQTITNMWNGTFTQNGPDLSVKDAGFNATIGANGGTASFGFNFNYSGTNGKPTSFTLNGTACQVQ